MPATVLDRVTADMRIYHEETFGPVACVVRVRGIEEAIRVANDTEYGLAASVFGRNVQRALKVAIKRAPSTEGACLPAAAPLDRPLRPRPVQAPKQVGYLEE